LTPVYRPHAGVQRSTVHTLSWLATHFPSHSAAGVLDLHKRFSLTQCVGILGPITVIDLEFGVDTWIRCHDERTYYQVNVLAAGRMDFLHRGSAVGCAPGLATVVLPEGKLAIPRWDAGTRFLAFRVDRTVVEDALSEALGRELAAQIDFSPAMATTCGPARTWLYMFSTLIRELFRPDNSLTQPLVAKPYVSSLINAMLLAADHPYRGALTAAAKYVAPQAIRPAIEIIEAEPHLPLTVASLAQRCHISSRALQQGFVRHVGMSPMTYLRQVRLHRAHKQLLAADPSVDTVASIAKRWGYTNPGRFAAAHAARYGESPAETLHRPSRAIRAGQHMDPARRIHAIEPVPERSQSIEEG
jgi:AraC-like DNA-binding protein